MMDKQPVMNVNQLIPPVSNVHQNDKQPDRTLACCKWCFFSLAFIQLFSVFIVPIMVTEKHRMTLLFITFGLLHLIGLVGALAESYKLCRTYAVVISFDIVCLITYSIMRKTLFLETIVFHILVTMWAILAARMFKESDEEYLSN